ncbi:hypothetical protein ES705_36077 [subsurface metagenome]
MILKKMKFNRIYMKVVAAKITGKYFKKTLARSLLISLTIVVIVFLIHCESNDRFYRPNLPEKLCCIGIIDIDDTANYNFYPVPFDVRNSARFISFEKSYQAEYPEELNDSLRELSFSISSSDKELFNYRSDSAIKNLLGFELPAGIEFSTGKKYYLRASEKSTPDISAEITVPELPSKLTLISINKEITTLSEPTECTGDTIAKSATISFSFTNNAKQNQYYALLMEGSGFTFSSSGIPYSGLLDFSVRDCNSPGFFAIMHSLNMFHNICQGNSRQVEKSPVFAYFIEGNKITDNECIITLSTQFQDSYAVYDGLKSIRIKLLSIPETLYLFEKSLYTYGKVCVDPFSEPVYLNGNIEGGKGVFAICRSSELIINFSPLYW